VFWSACPVPGPPGGGAVMDAYQIGIVLILVLIFLCAVGLLWSLWR